MDCRYSVGADSPCSRRSNERSAGFKGSETIDEDAEVLSMFAPRVSGTGSVRMASGIRKLRTDAAFEQSRQHMRVWAAREKAAQPDKPVYFKIQVISAEYTRYVPLLGWVPTPPELFLASIGITREAIEPPHIDVEDNSLRLLNPGKTTTFTYTELEIP